MFELLGKCHITLLRFGSVFLLKFMGFLDLVRSSFDCLPLLCFPSLILVLGFASSLLGDLSFLFGEMLLRVKLLLLFRPLVLTSVEDDVVTSLIVKLLLRVR